MSGEQSNYKIENGIPLPEDKAARLARLRQELPFDDLEVGQSFVVPGDRRAFDAIDIVFMFTEENGPRFTTKAVKVDNELVQRIWRTA